MRNSIILMVCIFLLAACSKEDSEVTKKDAEEVKKDVYFLSKITSNDIIKKTSWVCDFVYDDKNHLVSYNENSVEEKTEKSNVIIWKDNKAITINGNISREDHGVAVEASYKHEISYIGDNVKEIKSSYTSIGESSIESINYEYDANNNLSKFSRLGNKDSKNTSSEEFVCSLKYNKEGNLISFNGLDIKAEYDDISNPFLLTGLPISIGLNIYHSCYENNVSKNNCLEFTKYNLDEDDASKSSVATCKNKYEDGRLIETSFILEGKIVESFKYEYVKAK